MSSTNNTIRENNINMNDYGLTSSDGNNNHIYHNNFIKNTVLNAYDYVSNIWDDEYPSGGNYWDDYTGTDSDGDGIGDIPYDIPNGDNQDRYPLINPNGWINNPPHIPKNPYPSDNSSDIDINSVLNWTGGDPDPEDKVTYNIYFEANDSIPDFLVSENQSEIIYNPGKMAINTTYYWQVIAWDNNGASAVGPIWNFTTCSFELGIEIKKPKENSFYFRNKLRRLSPLKTIIWGPIDIEVNITHDKDIKKVDFLIDNKLKESISNPPYSYKLRSIRSFKHTIEVIVYDIENNTASDSIEVWNWRFHPIIIGAAIIGIVLLLLLLSQSS
jgi:hypothetical protein